MALTGVGLASTNKLAVVTGGDCGENTATLAALGGLTNPQLTSSDGTAYDFGTLLGTVPQSSSFALCWARRQHV